MNTSLNNEGKSEKKVSTAKSTASVSLGGITEKLLRLEEAMAEERMGDVYRLYWHELPEALQQSVNKNHEFDDFLRNKLQEEFEGAFPFMIVQDQLSPILVDYKIGDYYHDRATIQVDAAQPNIIIMPKIREEWEMASQGKFKKQMSELQKELDQLDAKIISAKAEVAILDEEIEKAETEKDQLAHNRGLLNRKKMDEEIEAVDQKLAELRAERENWSPYLNSDLSSDNLKYQISTQIKEVQLQEAIALKELRLITKHFGSLKDMEKALASFLRTFLRKEAK